MNGKLSSNHQPVIEIKEGWIYCHKKYHGKLRLSFGLSYGHNKELTQKHASYIYINYLIKKTLKYSLNLYVFKSLPLKF